VSGPLETRVNWLTDRFGVAEFGASSDDTATSGGAAMAGILPASARPGEASNANSDLERRVKRLEQQMRDVLRELRRLKRANQTNDISRHVLSADVPLDQAINEWASLPGLSTVMTPRGKATLHITGVLRVSCSDGSKVAGAQIAVRVMVNGVEQDGRGTHEFTDNDISNPQLKEVSTFMLPFNAVVDVYPKKSYSIVVQAANVNVESPYFTVETGGSGRGDSNMTIETHAQRKKVGATTPLRVRTFLRAAAYDAFNDRIVVLRERARWKKTGEFQHGNFPTSSPDKLDLELAYYDLAELPVSDFEAKPGHLIYSWKIPDSLADREIWDRPGRVAARASDGVIFVEYLQIPTPFPWTGETVAIHRKLVDPAGYTLVETTDELALDGTNDGFYSEGAPLFLNGSIYTGGYYEDDSNGGLKWWIMRLSDSDLSVTAHVELTTISGENNTRQFLGMVAAGSDVRAFFVGDHSSVQHFYWVDFDTATNTWGTPAENLNSETEFPFGWPNFSQVVPHDTGYALAVQRAGGAIDIHAYAIGDAVYGTLLVDDQPKLGGESAGLIVTAGGNIIFVQGSVITKNDTTTARLEEVYNP